MKVRFTFRVTARQRLRGLTLVEIMVASTLLFFITLGLTAMFNQTQKAFKAGVKQVDVLEGGRATMQLLTRDFDQLASANHTAVTNFELRRFPAKQLRQYKNGAAAAFRTNEINEIFGLTYINGEWIGIGYIVTNIAPGIGSLHRYTVTNRSEGLTVNDLYTGYSDAVRNAVISGNYSSFHRIMDGVIHFKINTLDTNGAPANTNAVLLAPYSSSYPFISNGVFVSWLPSALEIELGVLEPQTLEQARGMPSAAASNYVGRLPERVHIFRHQIPVRPSRQ